MEILKLELEYGKTIKKRGRTKMIIVCDTGSQDMGVYDLHSYYSNQDKRNGLPFHYLIDMNGQVIEARPKQYKASMNEMLDDNIFVAIQGDTEMSQIQSSQQLSLCNLLKMLLEQECVTILDIKTLSSLTGEKNPGSQFFLAPIIQSIKDDWFAKDKKRILMDTITVDNNGLPSDSIGFRMVTPKDNVDKISAITSVPKSKLQADNASTNFKTASDGISFRPSDILFYKNNVLAMSYLTCEYQRMLGLSILTSVESMVNRIASGLSYAYATSNTTYGTSAKASFNASYDTWETKDLKLPGYQRANIVFKNSKNSGDVVSIPFLVSPSSFNDTKSTQQQMNKTSGGWFVMRLGSGMTNLSITGYMLDTVDIRERHRFLSAYNSYIKDRKDDYFEYFNDYSTSINVEGRTYNGYIQSINFQKSAVQQFMYQYSISFVALSESSAYDGIQNPFTFENRHINENVTANIAPTDNRNQPVVMSNILDLLMMK